MFFPKTWEDPFPNLLEIFLLIRARVNPYSRGVAPYLNAVTHADDDM